MHFIIKEEISNKFRRFELPDIMGNPHTDYMKELLADEIASLIRNTKSLTIHDKLQLLELEVANLLKSESKNYFTELLKETKELASEDKIKSEKSLFQNKIAAFESAESEDNQKTIVDDIIAMIADNNEGFLSLKDEVEALKKISTLHNGKFKEYVEDFLDTKTRMLEEYNLYESIQVQRIKIKFLKVYIGNLELLVSTSQGFAKMFSEDEKTCLNPTRAEMQKVEKIRLLGEFLSLAESHMHYALISSRDQDKKSYIAAKLAITAMADSIGLDLQQTNSELLSYKFDGVNYKKIDIKNPDLYKELTDQAAKLYALRESYSISFFARKIYNARNDPRFRIAAFLFACSAAILAFSCFALGVELTLISSSAVVAQIILPIALNFNPIALNFVLDVLYYTTLPFSLVDMICARVLCNLALISIVVAGATLISIPGIFSTTQPFIDKLNEDKTQVFNSATSRIDAVQTCSPLVSDETKSKVLSLIQSIIDLEEKKNIVLYDGDERCFTLARLKSIQNADVDANVIDEFKRVVEYIKGGRFMFKKPDIALKSQPEKAKEGFLAGLFKGGHHKEIIVLQ